MLALDGGVTSTSCFIAPDARLRPYLSTYYFTAIDGRGSEVFDLLNPEWSSARFRWSGEMTGAVHPDPLEWVPPAHFVGPTSRAGPFATLAACIASIGFLPLGWRRFMREPAGRWANRLGPAGSVASIVPMAALARAVDDAAGDVMAMASAFDALLIACMEASADTPPAEEARIRALHAALIDPDTASVGELADRVGIAERQLHRLSSRLFGFAPKTLLRRQRFLRTLEVIMRDPLRPWSGALDAQYYDQSHFNRDFRATFGMTPEAYRRMDHPVLAAAAAARIKALGAPLQALHLTGERIDSAAAGRNPPESLAFWP